MDQKEKDCWVCCETFPRDLLIEVEIAEDKVIDEEKVLVCSECLPEVLSEFVKSDEEEDSYEEDGPWFYGANRMGPGETDGLSRHLWKLHKSHE